MANQLLYFEGYWIVTAEQLFASTNQLEGGRIYSKEKSDFELENKGRKFDFEMDGHKVPKVEEVRKLHAQYKQEFKDCDAVKVTSFDRTAWWPVPKLANFIVKKQISFPVIDRRKVEDRSGDTGWQNNIVVIQPDEPASGPKLG